ncbi:MAG: sulfite exporter TauE/SafE family protein [Paracoccus sp. (in: a-proteobacteria)]
MDGFTTNTFLELATVAVGAGVAGGILAGLLGVGGGIVIVPALYFALSLTGIGADIAMKIAVGTSLTTIVFTSLASSRGHCRRGAVDMDLIRLWGPSILLGVVLGGFIGGYVSGNVLIAVFATVALLVAADMILRKGRADPQPKGFSKPVWAFFGILAGGISAMMGIGGGTIGVPLLNFLGYDIRRAVGTSSVLGCIIGLPGALIYAYSGLGAEGLPPFSLGYVNLLAAAVLIPLTTAFSQVGVRLAHAIPRRALRLAFGGFLLLTSIRMFIDLLGG